LGPSPHRPRCAAESLRADKLMQHGGSACGASTNQSGGRLWQNGRFMQTYDRLGPSLGSGGMGSVWAARVADSSASSGCSGSWVAVKAIPLELVDGAREAGSLQSGLRECLSTFRDLSPAHVVRYEHYWIEEPAHLPPEVHHFCQLSRAPRAPSVASNLNLEGFSDSVAACAQSLRFREAPGSAAKWPRSPSDCWNVPCSPNECPLTPSCFGESCGFVWESAGEACGGQDATPASPCARARAEEGAAWVSARLPPPACESAPPTCARVVLLIEMELMGLPPEGSVSAAAVRRLTLRAWLQLQDRTFSDAADVFSSLMLSVRHIHRKRIVHADLKPDNVFCVVERSKVTAVRIGDFGLAGENQLFRQFEYGMLRNSSALTGGTPGYAAPEILKSECDACSDKVDIFACAVVLLELLLPPLRTQMERIDLLHKFHSKKVVPDFIHTRLPKTRVLLQEMGEDNPVMRLSAEEVCKRFEKEVRKELCRSAPQMLRSLRCGDDGWRCSSAPVVQQGRRETLRAAPRAASQGEGAHGPEPAAGHGGGARGGNRRGGGGRKGRRRG